MHLSMHLFARCRPPREVVGRDRLALARAERVPLDSEQDQP